MCKRYKKSQIRRFFNYLRRCWRSGFMRATFGYDWLYFVQGEEMSQDEPVYYELPREEAERRALEAYKKELYHQGRDEEVDSATVDDLEEYWIEEEMWGMRPPTRMELFFMRHFLRTQYLYYSLKQWWRERECRRSHHDVVSDGGYCTPDSGGESFYCRRCGEHWNITYY